jgi:hypothetical protein
VKSNECLNSKVITEEEFQELQTLFQKYKSILGRDVKDFSGKQAAMHPNQPAH